MRILIVVFCFCTAICALPNSAIAQTNRPEVSLLNFVSLQYERTGGYAGIRSGMSVHSGMLWVNPDTRPNQRQENQSYPMSFNQQVDLFDNINAAGITDLVGDYRQRNLADGFDETLTLTISDAQNRDQRYVIKNYGDTAPRNFYRFIDYLNELRNHKTGQTGAATQNVDFDTFQSLSLNTVGGIAGMQTQVEILAPDTANGFQRWMIRSNERSRGRTVRHQSNIDPRDLDALFQSLSNADLPALNGKKYRQDGLFDGFNNTLIVTLRDGQKFTVENYGNQAPADFYTILAAVNQLKDKYLVDER